MAQVCHTNWYHVTPPNHPLWVAGEYRMQYPEKQTESYTVSDYYGHFE